MTYPYNFTMNDENNFQRMMPTQWDFSSGNDARLALVAKAAQTWLQDYSSSAGFTFDSNKSEFVGGVLRQKIQLESDEEFRATAAASADAEYGIGTLTPTAQNGATRSLSGGKYYYNIAGNVAGRRWDFPANNFSNITNIGTIRFKFIPQYDGTPSNNKYLFTHAGAGQANSIWIFHQSTGNFQCRIYNGAGSTFQLMNTNDATFGTGGPINLVQGQEYEMSVSWNMSLGLYYIFLDGVPIFSRTNGIVNTRTAFGNPFELGNSVDDSDSLIRDLQVFDVIKETADHSVDIPRTVLNYAGDKIDLPQSSYSGLGNVVSFDDFTGTDSNVPKYIVNGMYFTAGAWAISNGAYAQANTLSEVATNIGSLTASNTFDLSIVTNDSDVQMSVDETTIEYSGQEYANDPTMWILNVPGQQADGVISFDCDFDEPANTTVRFTMVVNGVNYWWNTGTLEIADGTPAQTNTLAEVQADFTDLNTVLTDGKLLQYRIWVTSDGTATPIIRSITSEVDFSFNCYAIRNCAVYLCVKLPDQMPETTAEVRVYYPKTFSHNNNYIVDSTAWLPVDAFGRIDISLFETETIKDRLLAENKKGATFECRYTDINNVQQTITLAKNKVVPNQDSSELELMNDLVA